MTTQGTRASVEQYNYDIIRKFTIMTLVWAVAGMGFGLFAAMQLAFRNSISESPSSPSAAFGRCIPLW